MKWFQTCPPRAAHGPCNTEMRTQSGSESSEPNRVQQTTNSLQHKNRVCDTSCTAGAKPRSTGQSGRWGEVGWTRNWTHRNGWFPTLFSVRRPRHSPRKKHGFGQNTAHLWIKHFRLNFGKTKNVSPPKKHEKSWTWPAGCLETSTWPNHMLDLARSGCLCCRSQSPRVCRGVCVCVSVTQSPFFWVDGAGPAPCAGTNASTRRISWHLESFSVLFFCFCLNAPAMYTTRSLRNDMTISPCASS